MYVLERTRVLVRDLGKEMDSLADRIFSFLKMMDTFEF